MHTALLVMTPRIRRITVLNMAILLFIFVSFGVNRSNLEELKTHTWQSVAVPKALLRSGTLNDPNPTMDRRGGADQPPFFGPVTVSLLLEALQASAVLLLHGISAQSALGTLPPVRAPPKS